MIIVGLGKDKSMRKVLFFSFIVSLFFFNEAFSSEYFIKQNFWGGSEVGWKVDTNVAADWGSPYIDTTHIQDNSHGTGDFRIKEGFACCGNINTWDSVDIIRGLKAIEESQDCKYTKNQYPCQDDQSVMVFLAREVYAYGAKFCLTQLSAYSDQRGIYISHQQPNWPGMNCIVLCEPGHDGPTCNQKVGTSNEDTPCDITDISASIQEVKRNKYEGNDALGAHWMRMGTAQDQDYFARTMIDNYYENVIYLGATDFMQHGVTARPILVSAVGVHPSLSVIQTVPAISGKAKTLCAQGFTQLNANGECVMNSKNCGSNAWCTGSSDSNFRSDIHKKVRNGSCNVIFCKDGTKALDSDFDCKEYDGAKTGRCEKKENSLYGKLVECSVGEIFNADTCDCDKAKGPKSKDEMRYGPMGRNTINVNDQCWTKTGNDDFKYCVLGTKTENK